MMLESTHALPQALGEIVSLDTLSSIGARALRVLVVLVVALVVVKVLRRSLPRVLRAVARRMHTRTGDADLELTKRSETLGGILVSIAIVTVWSVAVLMALREIGFDIAPVLAGAGVVGIAVGFGAQNLVRDVIAGAFMLLEDQVRVGDVAIVNGTGGRVVDLSLRTITLRSLDGTIHVFPNGTITTLANKTHEFAFYVFDVGVAYKEDVDRVMKVLGELGAELQSDETHGPNILEPIEVLGVDAFEDSAVIVKARIKTKPMEQWSVGREMNRRIKKRFDVLGIEMPFPHRTMYFGDASKPFEIRTLDRPGGTGEASSS